MSPDLLHTQAEARARRIAWAGAGGTLGIAMMFAFLLRRADLSLVYSAPIALILGWFSFQWLMASTRRRRQILAQPFPAEWEAVLQKDVVFYRALDAEGQARFRRELQVFLGEKRITGIKTDIDVTTRVLAGASAIIPIFGYPQWEWDQIAEVLIYPGRFGPDFGFEQGQDRNTLGMVGTGPMNRIMILSKPDLIHGFRNAADKRNVGLHEFAHLIDKSDGTIDGIPALGLDRETIGPWVELIRREMKEIEDGESDIDRYALTNEAEFFAVATEYLFERPELMQRKHPDLFAMMQKIFEQDLASRIGDMTRVRRSGPQRFGRNSPCPCGSGKKYKKCCLGNG